MGSNRACTNKTSGCRVRAYKHGNFRGRNHGVGQNDSNGCRKESNSGCCVNFGGISSYKVDGCPNNVVITGHYKRNAYSFPMGAGGPLGHSLALSGHQGGLPSGWNDKLWGFSFHKTPSANSNQISYDIATRGINAGGSGEIALPRQGISANRDDVILGTSKSSSRAARPCPGGKGSFLQGATKVRCLYSKTNANALQTLYSNKNGISADPRASMHASLKNTFCGISENIFKNPGGGSCLEYDTAKSLAKEYCSVGDRIAKDASCTPTNLGNFYAGIAETYCKTTAGKADPWCSCYNVTNGVCDTDSAAAGCDIKRQQFDKLVEATPEGFRNVWSGKAACFGGVCQGAKYVPQNANQNCNAPVQICAQSFDLSQISESTIEAQCNLTANTGTPPSAGDGPSGTPSGTPSGGIGDYIPQSLGDVRNDSKKQLAVGGVSALFMMCCCLLIIIVLMSSSGGGPSRFRR